MKKFITSLALLALATTALAACGGDPTATPVPQPTATTATSQNPPSTGDSTVNTAGQPERITVQHVLIGFKDAVGFQGSAPAGAQQRTEDQAKALAYEILDRAKKGESFDALVTQYTDDSPPGIYSMSNIGVQPQGDEYPRQGMVAAFGDVGFALKVGEIGISDYNLSTSPYGWHIIKRLK